MRKLIIGLAAALVVCSVTSAAVEVRFYDQGNLVVGAHVAVLADNPTYPSEKLAPSPDGIYTLNAEPGMKVTITVQSATTAYAPMEVSLLSGSMDVEVYPRQVNDLCADAIPLVMPALIAGSTIGATDEAPPADTCGTTLTAPGVWYTVMGTGNTITAATCNDGNPATGDAQYDTKLNVYCLGCDTLKCVTGTDDYPGCLGFSSLVTWCSQIDKEYHILVQGFFGSIGTFTLGVYDDGVPCDGAVDCTPPPPYGACCICLPSPFNCVEAFLDECVAFDGEFQGEDTTCLIKKYASAPVLPIPDGAGVFVCDTITVDESGIINDVNVAMTITHTWVGDLEILVDHNSVAQMLWFHQCGSTDNINSTADDEYNTVMCVDIATGPIWDVRWPPALGGLGPLSIYDGMDKQGDWTLCAADTFPADTGDITYWALQFNDQIFPNICDAEEEVEVCYCPVDLDHLHEDDHWNDHWCDDSSDDCMTILIAESAVEEFLADNPCSYLGPCIEDWDDQADTPEVIEVPSDETSDVFGR